MHTESNIQEEENQKPLLGADNNALVALLSINLVVYVTLGLIKTIYYLESLPLEQFYAQIFNPFVLTNNWLTYPWSILTYNWVHDGFWILLANMIWLSLFSFTLQVNGANKHIFPIYFYSGIMGAFVFILSGSTYTLMSANASVTAIVIASVLHHPKFKLLKNLNGGISLWIIGVLYLILQASVFSMAPFVYSLPIVAGGFVGIIYMVLLKKGIDLGKWMHQLLHLLNNSLAPKN